MHNHRVMRRPPSPERKETRAPDEPHLRTKNFETKTERRLFYSRQSFLSRKFRDARACGVRNVWSIAVRTYGGVELRLRGGVD